MRKMLGKRKIRRAARVIKALTSSRTKLSAYAFGHAAGIVSIIALLLYAFMTWFGDFNGSIIIQQYPINFSFDNWTVIIGLIETYVLAYIGGWIFVKIYNGVVR